MFLIYLKIGGRPNSNLAGSFHDFIILTVGTILGIIAATLFFLVNYYFVIKKNASGVNKIGLQIVLLLLSCLIVHEIHHILEFDLDII
ncbi:conserved hypothetical protein [Flavobacterium sp. 9AF]|uniref:hypothetical protein n=1 Tax=Flavobacterium sp. 9AF TaxID=2653142 RepID=UPI0012F2D2C7|nr:hypothetical protein [Flavobacterium sp. 9AF]VXB62360.1 conserved hypothetical protein [Flavobacterium sp. 9AF]